jgi:hypothetical protein
MNFIKGGVILNDKWRRIGSTEALIHFITNSNNIRILTDESISCVTYIFTLKDGVESPYITVRSTNLNSEVRQILLKVGILSDNPNGDRVQYLQNGEIKRASYRARRDFELGLHRTVEAEVTTQDIIFKRSFSDPISPFEPLCPGIICYSSKVPPEIRSTIFSTIEKNLVQRNNTPHNFTDKQVTESLKTESERRGITIIVMELMAGYDALSNIVKKGGETRKTEMYKKMQRYELERMTRYGYVHVDAHPGNVLIHPSYPYFSKSGEYAGRAIIIDFGRIIKPEYIGPGVVGRMGRDIYLNPLTAADKREFENRRVAMALEVMSNPKMNRAVLEQFNVAVATHCIQLASRGGGGGGGGVIVKPIVVEPIVIDPEIGKKAAHVTGVFRKEDEIKRRKEQEARIKAVEAKKKEEEAKRKAEEAKKKAEDAKRLEIEKKIKAAKENADNILRSISDIYDKSDIIKKTAQGYSRTCYAHGINAAKAVKEAKNNLQTKEELNKAEAAAQQVILFFKLIEIDIVEIKKELGTIKDKYISTEDLIKAYKLKLDGYKKKLDDSSLDTTIKSYEKDLQQNISQVTQIKAKLDDYLQKISKSVATAEKQANAAVKAQLNYSPGMQEIVDEEEKRRKKEKKYVNLEDKRQTAAGLNQKLKKESEEAKVKFNEIVAQINANEPDIEKLGKDIENFSKKYKEIGKEVGNRFHLWEHGGMPSSGWIFYDFNIAPWWNTFRRVVKEIGPVQPIFENEPEVSSPEIGLIEDVKKIWQDDAGKEDLLKKLEQAKELKQQEQLARQQENKIQQELKTAIPEKERLDKLIKELDPNYEKALKDLETLVKQTKDALDKKTAADKLVEKLKLDRINRKKAEVDAEAARIKAALEAKQKEEEEARQKAEAEVRRRAEAEARRKAEAEAIRQAASAKRKAELEAQQRAEAEAKRKAEEEAKRKAEVKAREKAALEAKQKAEAEARRKEEAEAKQKEEAAIKKAEAEAEAARIVAEKAAAQEARKREEVATYKKHEKSRKEAEIKLGVRTEPKETCRSDGVTLIPTCMTDKMYRELAKELHPDKNPSCKETAEEKFKLLNSNKDAQLKKYKGSNLTETYDTCNKSKSEKLEELYNQIKKKQQEADQKFIEEVLVPETKKREGLKKRKIELDQVVEGKRLKNVDVRKEEEELLQVNQQVEAEDRKEKEMADMFMEIKQTYLLRCGPLIKEIKWYYELSTETMLRLTKVIDNLVNKLKKDPTMENIREEEVHAYSDFIKEKLATFESQKNNGALGIQKINVLMEGVPPEIVNSLVLDSFKEVCGKSEDAVRGFNIKIELAKGYYENRNQIKSDADKPAYVVPDKRRMLRIFYGITESDEEKLLQGGGDLDLVLYGQTSIIPSIDVPLYGVKREIANQISRMQFDREDTTVNIEQFETNINNLLLKEPIELSFTKQLGGASIRPKKTKKRGKTSKRRTRKVF